MYDPRTVIVNGQVDWTQFPLPQVYFAPDESQKNALASLTQAMPPEDGFERTFKRPTVHPDGSIEFEKSFLDPAQKPDDIEGYVRDPDNHWRFTPKWEPCAYRLQGVKLLSSGAIDVKMACNHPEAATYGQPVSCKTCTGCVLRTATKLPNLTHTKRYAIEARDFEQPEKLEDGTLVYPKTGFEPPVCPEGYHRSPTNMWAFIPEWQACVHRTFENSVRPCGCVNINAVCHSPESGHDKERVPFITCQGCPVRKPGPEVIQIQ